MANCNKKIQETTLTAGNRRMIISEDGVWIDHLNPNGTVESSGGVAWEELESHEVQGYMSLYESIDPQELRKAG